MKMATRWEKPVLDAELIQIIGLGLGGLAIAGVSYALLFPHLSGEKAAEKRIHSVTENRTKRTARVAQVEQASSRKQQVADTLKDLENKQRAREKVSLRLRLQRAGLDVSTNVYWIASGVAGLLAGLAVLLGVPAAPKVAAVAAVFVGAFGIPRWVVNHMTRRRQRKFIDGFAIAIDIIVRGVKTGLPLNECLGIIARESPEPLNFEFQEVIDQSRIGVPLIESLDRMMQRVPLPEVKFFSIVIGIQQQAGGNLSEALGNLSGVLRDRKTLGAKVRALSSEARASAWVLGSLPFIVMLMVYFTTPKYISILFTSQVGNFLLGIAAFWMTCGLLVMKKMINFKF